MATLYLKTAGGNFNAAGTWSNVNASGGDSSGPPTAADNCIAELLSGNVTINTGSVCRSFDTTSGTGSYGGTITHTSGVTWTIGDATAGAGNVAFKLNSGVTYNLGAVATSALRFVSTSTTQQSIAFGTKTHGNLTFDGVGGSWILADASTGGAMTTTLTNGTFNTGGQTCTWNVLSSNNSNTRVLTLGASSISLNTTATAINFTDSTNLTFNADTSSITSTGTIIEGGNKIFNTLILTGGGNVQVRNVTQVANLTRTGTIALVDIISFNNNPIITTTFTLNGNSRSNRLILQSSTFGTQRTVTLTGATVSASNVDIRDMNFSVATDLSGITGGSGDAGGNTGITFTTPATFYWVGNSGDLSDGTNHWATSSGGSPGVANFPLPQDTGIFDSNSFSVGGQTVTQDVPRMGNLIFTDVTKSPTLTQTATFQIYGSITLGSMTWNNNANTLQFLGRGADTLTSAGGSFSGNVTVNKVAGSLTLNDAFSSTTGTLDITSGTFTSGGFNITVPTFSSNTANTRTVNITGSTVTVTATSGNVWNFTSVGTLTFISTGSTISVTNTGASSKTFAGSGQVYNNIVFSGDNIIVSGSNTFSNLAVNNAGLTNGLKLTAGTTQTVSSFSTNGSSGSLAMLLSSSAGNPATLSKSSGIVSVNFMSIKDSAATGGATWYAGANSINVSGNSGWIFTGAVYTESLDDTIVEVTTLSDLQNYIDVLSTDIPVGLTGQDLQNYIDNNTITIIAEIVNSDLQNYLDGLTFDIVSDITLSDTQTYVEGQNFTIVSDVTITEEQTQTDTLSFTIVSEVTATDIQSYVHNLSFDINSEVSLSEIYNQIESLNIVIQAIVEVLDNFVPELKGRVKINVHFKDSINIKVTPIFTHKIKKNFIPTSEINIDFK